MKKISLIILTSLSMLLCHAQPWQNYADSAGRAEEDRKYTASLNFYNQAKALLPADSGSSMMLAELYRKIGELNLRLSNFSVAENNLRTALKLAKQKGAAGSILYGIICDRMARVLDKTNPNAAEYYYKESLVINEKIFGDSSLQFAAACNGMGNHYVNNGNYEKALSMHFAARSIKEHLLSKTDPDYARSCNNLAYVYFQLGEYEKAEPLALEAKKIRSMMAPANGHPDYAITITNLANIYREMGQFEKAGPLYLEAREIRSHLLPKNQNAEYASSCNILADFYAFTGDDSKAEALYKEAMQIREKNGGKKSLDYAESCNNLANLYLNTRRFKIAESLALQAKKIWDRQLPPGSPDLAINRNNLGQLYFAAGNDANAFKYFNEARTLWQKSLGITHPFFAGNTADLAKVYRVSGNAGKANTFYNKAVALQKLLLEKIFRFTSEAEQQAYLKNRNNFTDEYLSFYASDFDRTKAGNIYDHLLLNRNLMLSAHIQVRSAVYNSNNSELRKRYDAWLEERKALAFIYSNAPEQKESVRLSEQKADDDEKWLAQHSAEFGRSLRTSNWKDIRKHLLNDEACIEYTSFRYFDGHQWTDSLLYAALVIRKDLAEPVMINLFEQKQFDSVWGSRQVQPDINGLYNRGPQGVKLLKKSKALYDLAWKPLQQTLSGIKKVYFAPAADLFKISFAAISVNDTTVLADLYQLEQVNSTANIADENPQLILRTDSLVLFGGITYQSNAKTAIAAGSKEDKKNDFVFLPGTLEEVSAIKKQATATGYSAQVVSGTDASEEFFKGQNWQTTASVLHIATHGFFLEKPADIKDSLERLPRQQNALLRSGLAFANAGMDPGDSSNGDKEDGIVTAFEIANMHLPKTKLVVLSACETALGDIEGEEGVYGLQRAFKMAGADYLLMSLWSVPDKETAEFMRLFYDRLFLQVPVQTAFYSAQQEMKSRYRNSPQKWAAWILTR